MTCLDEVLCAEYCLTLFRMNNMKVLLELPHCPSGRV